jgi:hypothetical protein
MIGPLCLFVAIIVAGVFLLILYEKTWVLQYLFFYLILGVSSVKK